MQYPVLRQGPCVEESGSQAMTGYALHGLRVASSIDVPFHPWLGPSAPADIRIERGSVPVSGELVWKSTILPNCTCLRHEDAIVIAWDEARFAVRPDHVVVDATDEDVMRQLLIQPVWSILLTARGRQALHACAVERDGRAIAVAGNSGNGKSTAALTLIDQGWRLLTDDLLTLDEHDRAYPGPPYMRLRPDRAASRAGTWDDFGKLRYIPDVCPMPVPVHTVIILDDQFESVQPLPGFRAVDALLRHVYNPILTHPGQAGQRFDFAMQMARTATIVGAPPRSLTSTQLVELASQGGAR